MTGKEIEVVAQELAKAGGTSWYSTRKQKPLIKPVTDCFRDHSRIAIAALDRLRAGRAMAPR